MGAGEGAASSIACVPHRPRLCLPPLLPLVCRQLQAALYNTPRTSVNVLSASDAVGMGLNLSIRRIVFSGLRKFDGVAERPLTVAEIKQVCRGWLLRPAPCQPATPLLPGVRTYRSRLPALLLPQIAGRAGRFGSRFPNGVVTATCSEDLATLAEALQQPSEELQAAFVFPSLAQLELLHGQFPEVCVCVLTASTALLSVLLELKRSC